MSNSSDLAAALNNKMVNEAFEIARKNRTGILATIAMGAAKRPYEGYKQSWTDAYKGADAVTTGATHTAVITTLTVVDSSVLRPGMLLANGNEVMYVSSVTNATTAVVVRGVGGTVAETTASGAVLTIDSVGRAENSLAAEDNLYQPELTENYFQTMDTTINMSRRALATLQYGDTNDLQFQLAERLRQLAINMDRMIIRGRRFTQGAGDSLISYAGGMKFYNDQAGAIKLDGGGAAMTQVLINNLNEEIVLAGGTTNTLAVSVAKARDIHAIIKANYDSQRLSDWSSDEGSVFQLPSDMPLIGNVNNIVIDSNLADTEILMYDSTKMAIVPMAAANGSDGGDWRTIDATAKGQDGESVRILGDFSFECRQSKSHMGLLSNLTA
tara:strand:+ start:15239 stop:16390 length:1152 start_codon:yes stop_codon:yes gene_type:complete